jgi:hypothetical protein
MWLSISALTPFFANIVCIIRKRLTDKEGEFSREESNREKLCDKKLETWQANVKQKMDPEGRIELTGDLSALILLFGRAIPPATLLHLCNMQKKDTRIDTRKKSWLQNARYNTMHILMQTRRALKAQTYVISIHKRTHKRAEITNL